MLFDVHAAVVLLPVQAPKKDLQLTIKFYSYNTGTFPFTSTLLSTRVVTLTYNSLGGTFLDTWTGSVLCPDSVSRTATIHCKQVGTGDPYGFVNGSWPIGVSPYGVGPAGSSRRSCYPLQDRRIRAIWASTAE